VSSPGALHHRHPLLVVLPASLDREKNRLFLHRLPALSKWCGKGGAKVLLLDAQRRLVRQDLAGSFVPNEQRQLVAVVYSEIGAGRVPLSQPGGQSGF
jgi:hypothetical protein